jgi:hypothetical protein
MSLGGGGGGSTETTVTNQNMPKEVVPYFMRALDRGEAASQEAYQPFGGQRIADTTADTNQSYNMIRGIAAAGTPGADRAMGIMSSGADAAGAIGGRQPYQYSQFGGFQAGQADPYAGFNEANFSEFGFGPTETMDASAASQYMDPYLRNVLDVQKDKAREEFQMGNAGRAAQAVNAGAFGGSRSAVQQGLAERDMQNRMKDIEATGLSSAYADAASRFAADRAAKFQAEQARAGELGRVQSGTAAEMARVQQGQAGELGRTQGLNIGEQARIQGAQAGEVARVQQGQAGENLNYAELGLDALRTQGDFASNLASLEAAARSGDIRAAQLLASQGAQQQAQTQAGLDIGYEDFLAQRDYPMSNLERYTAMLHGSPIGNARTTSTSVPTNPVKDYLGMGISALGLYNAMG